MANKTIKSKRFWLLLIAGVILLAIGGLVINNYLNRPVPLTYQVILSPEDVVRVCLIEEKYEEGTISLDIINVKEVDKSHYVSRVKDSERWKSNGWSAENIAVVRGYYIAKYDNTKVPFNSGKLCQEFYLSRKDKNSPWMIHDAMSPYDI